MVCLRAVSNVADYIAVNVSSPNTASLRDLHRPERLEPLLTALLSERDAIGREIHRHLPIVLKISPDLDVDSLKELSGTALRLCLDGIIATNTTIRRDYPMLSEAGSQAGGMSGTPLYELSLTTVTTLRQLLGPVFPIIGVGGVDSPDKALAMRRAGADLVQIFTGMIYRGPSLVPDCVRALSRATPDDHPRAPI
jgi:dihydroorotate dehydrogenase